MFLSFSLYIYMFIPLSFDLYIHINIYTYIYIYMYRRIARVQTTQQTPSAPSLFFVLASSINALVFDASLRRSLG